MNAFDNHVIRFLIVSLCYFDLPTRPAHAELAKTRVITASGQVESARQKLERYLGRDDVRAGMVQNGVKPAAARARAGALSDGEVAAIAGRIDSLPGSGERVGALVFLFVLLLLTDILRFTKVYSFTRSVRK